MAEVTPADFLGMAGHVWNAALLGDKGERGDHSEVADVAGSGDTVYGDAEGHRGGSWAKNIAP